MERSWWMRLGLLVSLLSLALFMLYPSYFFYAKATPQQKDSNQAFCQALPGWSPCAKLNLGLDLQGGVHLVMGVRTDKAIEHRLDRLSDLIHDGLDKEHVVPRSLERPRGTQEIVARFDAAGPQDAAAKFLRRQYPMLEVRKKGDDALSVRLNADEIDQVRTSAVEQSIKTIRNRADKLGVTEPTIARRGLDSIVIQLPGVKDPQHAIDLIGRTAQLEFSMVDDKATSAFAKVSVSDLPDGAKKIRPGHGVDRGRDTYFEIAEADKDAVEAVLVQALPNDKALAFGPATNSRHEEVPNTLRTYVINARSDMTGDMLLNAQVQQNPEIANDYYVTMTFDVAGAKQFEKLTEKNVGKRMAIVLDGKVSSAPSISEKIGGGTARITLGRGQNSQAKFQEAKDLVLVLKAGALPAPVEIREKRQVGKTLGQDTVAKGTLAMIVGTALVIVFMAVYYRRSGMMANVALLLNVVFMMAALAACEATLTLPGMAGIVLTIGMAVDANVLIFERIREELRAGKSARAAMDAGYKKAFGTIFDSNITTMIAGVVLMQYGSGPVRGFAVTLIIGLSCSLYTAIVVTRLLHDLTLYLRPNATISI